MSMRAWILFASCVALPATAHAYLDPGTGSILLQGLIAAIAAGLAIGRMYWAKLKALFRGTRGTKSDGDEAAPH